uniref:Uncharacterized protein n=1 Tax=Anguilla anguilla TaxID=7936 RepID=A0A0E9RQJ1_ANGAN
MHKLKMGCAFAPGKLDGVDFIRVAVASNCLSNFKFKV